MSGLLRRIKRSRVAHAGEPRAEGDVQAVDGAPGAPGGDATPPPAAPPAAEPALPAGLDPGAEPRPRAARRVRLLRYLRHAREPMLRDLGAAPALPAGVDPGAEPRRPAGRRGQLRRRLRYLRRARELMLRDLGGLLYEVHRTGAGNMDAHAGIIAPKVARLAAADAEAHALEAALGAPRADAVVFEPGVGGACGVCGEYFASEARFCSHCGTATDPHAVSAAPGAEPDAGAGRADVAGDAVPGAGRPADPLPAAAEPPTSVLGEPPTRPLDLAPAPHPPTDPPADGGAAGDADPGRRPDSLAAREARR